MGKVSGYIDKRLIFRETFNNEQSVRVNGGSPTNMVFDKGIAIFKSSYIIYKIKLVGTYSIRIKLSSVVTANNTMFIDFRGTTGYIADNPNGSLLVSSGTTYVNGNSSTTITSETKEIIVSNITINTDVMTVGAASNLTWLKTMSVESIEIYKGVLSAQDVKNLYEGRYNKKVDLNNKEELLGAECLRDGNYINDSTWGKHVTAWEFINGIARYNASETGRAITQTNANMAIPLKAYTLYRLDFIISDCENLAYPYFLTAAGSAMYYPYPVQHSISRFPNGNHTIYFYTNDQAAQGFGLFAYTQGSAFTISNISIKEVIVCKTPSILNVFSPRGSLIEKNGFTFTNTNVSVKKQAEIFTSFFTTQNISKLDFGANDLHKDKTYICWIKTVGWNTVLDSRVLDNGRSMVLIVGTNPQYRVTNDGGATFGNAYSNSAKVNNWELLIITRFTRGNCPVYVNGNLASSININGNVVVPATTNLFIGNNAVNTRQHYGFIDNFRIVDGILSTDEIAQIFSSERRKYNV